MPRMFVTRSIDGRMALLPTPILVQSMVSPSSSKMILPTTIPFSDATTFSDDRVQPIMRRVVEHVVRLGLLLEELDVGVEEVALGDDALAQSPSRAAARAS